MGSPKNILSPWAPPPPYYFNSMFLITCIICPRLLFCSLKHIMILSQLYKPLPPPPLSFLYYRIIHKLGPAHKSQTVIHILNLRLAKFPQRPPPYISVLYIVSLLFITPSPNLRFLRFLR